VGCVKKAKELLPQW